MFPDLGRILLLSGYGGSRSRTRSEPPGSSPFVVNMRLITTNPGCLRGFHTTIFHHPLDEDSRHSADLYGFYLKKKQTTKKPNKPWDSAHPHTFSRIFPLSRGAAGCVRERSHTSIVVLVPVLYKCQHDNLRAAYGCCCRFTPHEEIWLWNHNIPSLHASLSESEHPLKGSSTGRWASSEAGFCASILTQPSCTEDRTHANLNEMPMCNYSMITWAVAIGCLCDTHEAVTEQVLWCARETGPTAFHLASLPGRGRVAHDDNGQSAFLGRPAAFSSRSNLDYAGTVFPETSCQLPSVNSFFFSFNRLSAADAVPRRGRVWYQSHLVHGH